MQVASRLETQYRLYFTGWTVESPRVSGLSEVQKYPKNIEDEIGDLCYYYFALLHLLGLLFLLTTLFFLKFTHCSVKATGCLTKWIGLTYSSDKLLFFFQLEVYVPLFYICHLRVYVHLKHFRIFEVWTDNCGCSVPFPLFV